MEVGRAHGLILLRDTNDRAGTTLSVPPTAWTAFLAAVR